MLNGHHINLADPAYAPSLVRPPSPSSSIGTDYGPDQTTAEEAQLTRDEFAAECEAKLKLNEPRPEEIEASKPILLRRPKTQAEEKELFREVMNNLRRAVRELQEDELYEQIMLRGTQIAEVTQPSSSNVDSIMSSIMGPPVQQRASIHTLPETVFTSNSPFGGISPIRTSSPARSHVSPFGSAAGEGDTGSNAGTPSKRATRGRKGKGRK
ncbi:hypothetical protein K474DRAFT_1613218, partial [Panus rudis PR-1116 ss-1]